MTSLILNIATRYLLPLMLMYSVFVMLRGHNEPGGGFVGGLVASAGFALYALAHGFDKAKEMLLLDSRTLISAGLLVALGSGMLSLVNGQPFMTGLWRPEEIPAIGKLGTPFLFDVGVYLVVLGVILTIIFSMAEEE